MCLCGMQYCGCHTSDADDDGDGLRLCEDVCPKDAGPDADSDTVGRGVAGLKRVMDKVCVRQAGYLIVWDTMTYRYMLPFILVVMPTDL